MCQIVQLESFYCSFRDTLVVIVLRVTVRIVSMFSACTVHAGFEHYLAYCRI
jgi:hypothetical protein